MQFEPIYTDEISDGFDWIEHQYITEHVNKVMQLDIAELWHDLKSYTQTADPSFLQAYRRKLSEMMEMAKFGTHDCPLGYIEQKRNAYQNDKNAKREVYDV